MIPLRTTPERIAELRVLAEKATPKHYKSSSAKQKAFKSGRCFGCHVEVGVGEEPDKDCVLDHGAPGDCTYAHNRRSKWTCEYWQPLANGAAKEPDTNADITDLTAENERLRAELAAMTERYCNEGREAGQLRLQLTAADAEIARLETELGHDIATGYGIPFAARTDTAEAAHAAAGVEAERQDTIIAEVYQAVGALIYHFGLSDNADCIRIQDMLAYGKTKDGIDLLPWPRDLAALKAGHAGEVTDAMALEAMIKALELDEEYSPKEARRLIVQGKDTPHNGDCTKRPYTCVRCVYEDAITRGRAILSAALAVAPTPTDLAPGLRRAAEIAEALPITTPKEDACSWNKPFDQRVTTAHDAALAIRTEIGDAS